MAEKHFVAVELMWHFTEQTYMPNPQFNLMLSAYLDSDDDDDDGGGAEEEIQED